MEKKPSDNNVADELNQVAELYDLGVLSEEEFKAAKRKILEL